ncbi:MAG: DUF1934 domain-containing protein [Lachnospiraceae bacterium]|nr:DUF1934 domain-containing protein [Lachnospiraceae bacterium]
MTKEVLMSLKGLQFENADGGQELETITAADYYKKNGSHYVLYDEVTEGFDDVTKNMLKFHDSCLEVTKRGLINVHMVFEENQKNMTSYATPFGNILIGIDTESVLVEELENQIRVQVAYTLEANYQYLADCKIDMKICPREESVQLL